MSTNMFKAVTEFRINFNGNVDSIFVKPGTVFTFDGYSVEIVGLDGIVMKVAAPSLNKVVGDWFIPVTEIIPQIKQAPVVNKAEQEAARAVVNSSAIGSENTAELIDKYEVASNLRDRKAPTIIDDDASIVGKVRKVAGESGITKNTSGVQMEDSEVGKRTVISQEERLVKKTKYGPNPTLDPSEPTKQRKPVIITDGEGVVVKKTTVKAIFKDQIRPDTVTDADKVYVENSVVKETSYEEPKGIAVGSTTQAQVVSKVAGDKRALENKAARLRQISGDQEGTVVAKVRKDKSVEVTGDGFTSKLTVGKNEEKEGVVEFGNNVGGDIDGIIGGEAVITGGGNVNASDPSAEATIVRSSGKSEDVDIGDIINDI
jgi:hypothetical protein